jgi:hypothetical protein
MESRHVARVLLLAALVIPGRAVHGAPAVCPFRRVTGRPCPACGLTRSWQAAAHGRPIESLRWHPLGMLTMSLAAWLAVDRAAEERLDRVDRRWLAAVAAGWIGVWLLRGESAPSAPDR